LSKLSTQLSSWLLTTYQSIPHFFIINKFDNQLASKIQKFNNLIGMTIIIQVSYQSLNTHTKKNQKKKNKNHREKKKKTPNKK